MREIIQIAWDRYTLFHGTGMHIALFLAALLLMGGLCKADREKSDARLLSGYSGIFFLIFFCPLTAKIIMEYCIGSQVYWRMFWILPIPLVIAYAFALRLKSVENRWKRTVCFICMFLAIAVTGSAVYTSENFSKADNIYKIPQEVIDVCDFINEDAAKNDIERKKAAVANELLPYIRQYDGSIKMPYGRNALKENYIRGKSNRKVFAVMNDPQGDFENFVKCLRKAKCNYLVYYKMEDADAALCNLGCVRIGESSGYYVYRLEI